MNYFDVLKTIFKHQRLAEQRSILRQDNLKGKIFAGIIIAGTIGYLIFFAIVLALAANSSDISISAAELMFGMLPFMLLVDFSLRLFIKQTPPQLIKPYTLLPISKNSCIDAFILRELFSLSNLIWLSLTVPYALMSILFQYDFLAALLFVLTLHLTILASSMFYVCTRTLINRSVAWWILPIAVFGMMATPTYIGENPGLENLLTRYAAIGNAINDHSLAPLLAAAAAIFLLFFVNRFVVRTAMDQDEKRQEDNDKMLVNFGILGRYGITGDFMQLEIKSLFRNKNPRKSFIYGLIIAIVFGLLKAFTDIYSSNYSSVFWDIYILSIFSIMLLSQTPSFEYKYINCFHTIPEAIYHILKAKYYLYTILILIPAGMFIPTIFLNKLSGTTLVADILCIAGIQHALLLQAAPYNRVAAPLNTRLVGSTSTTPSYMKIIITSAAIILPSISITTLHAVLGTGIANLIIGSLGLILIATHKYWLKNIAKRIEKNMKENNILEI